MLQWFPLTLWEVPERVHLELPSLVRHRWEQRVLVARHRAAAAPKGKDPPLKWPPGDAKGWWRDVKGWWFMMIDDSWDDDWWWLMMFVMIYLACWCFLLLSFLREGLRFDLCSGIMEYIKLGNDRRWASWWQTSLWLMQMNNVRGSISMATSAWVDVRRTKLRVATCSQPKRSNQSNPQTS